jgi:hypothetical protein
VCQDVRFSQRGVGSFDVGNSIGTKSNRENVSNLFQHLRASYSKEKEEQMESFHFHGSNLVNMKSCFYGERGFVSSAAELID